MTDYVRVLKNNDSITVCFYIEEDKIIDIGEKINEINENAYMNGYNWEAFFNFYLSEYAPDVMENMESDPEAGMYVAYYDSSSENEIRANKFLEIICSLIENPENLFDIIRKYGDEIDWD